MLIINGVNIFPMQVEKALLDVAEVGDNYVIEVHKQNYMDKLHVKVEITPGAFGGTLAQLEGLQKRTTEALRAELLVTPIVELVEAGSLPRAEGKAQRVFDRRGE
jgi:phenylacetate-CoA ligase